MLDKRTQVTDERLTMHEAKLKEQAKRISNLGNRIALPSTLFYILITAILFLSLIRRITIIDVGNMSPIVE